METSCEQGYWDKWYQAHPLRYEPQNVPFKDLFERYLPVSGSCFEVGCYPGHYLTYLCKRFNYTANGIDSSQYVVSRLRDYLSSLEIQIGDIYQADFFTFKTDRTYDLVCSFGFVEHYWDVETVIEMHADLVKPGGVLVVMAPISEESSSFCIGC